MTGLSGTSIRPLGRIFESLDRPVYLFGDGKVEYFNRALAQWVGEASASKLLKLNEASASPDASRLLRSLLPEVSVSAGSQIMLPVQPIVVSSSKQPASKEVLFVELGSADESKLLAIADLKLNPDHSEVSADLIPVLNELHAVRARYPNLSSIGPLIGTSPQAEKLRRQVSTAAASNASVFLVGRDGSGGEQIALGIHASDANRMPLVTIDSALMDEELFEATMSPVIATVTGRDDAHATVLLRQIDKMPTAVQIRLLAYMAEYEGKIRCLSLSCISSDQSRSKQRIETKLSFELSTLEIQIPSLRDRVADLPQIAQVLIDRHASHRAEFNGISRSGLDALITYPWPGDFIELDAAMRHAANHCRAASIGPSDLPLAIRSYRPADPSVASDERLVNLDGLLANIELELISRALEKSDGNRAEAARRLGISRARLLRRLGTGEGAGEE